MKYVLDFYIALHLLITVSCLKINSNLTEITLTSKASITLMCEDKFPVKWVYPQYENEPSYKSIKESMENGTYFSEFTLSNAFYLDTGYYTCEPKNKTTAEEFPSIYIYVFDSEHLLAINESVMMLEQNEFGDVVIPCKPTSPEVEVILKDELDEIINLPYDSKMGFILKSPNVTDSKTVICTAKENQNEAFPFDIVINPITTKISKPFIEVSPYHLIEGNNATLNCSIHLGVGIKVFITWKYPDELIKKKVIEDSQKSITEEKKEGPPVKIDYRTITITNLTKYDQGNYICEVEDYNKNLEETSYYVNIHSIDSTFLNISVQGDLNELTVRAGESSVQWIINVTAYPRPNITWKDPYKNEITQHASHSGKYIVIFDGRIAKLAINKIDITDSGMYELVATNGNHSKIMNLTLFVQDQPVAELKNDSQYYNYEQNYRVDCTVTGYPLPDVKWYTKTCNDYPLCENSTFFQITSNYEEVRFATKPYQLKSVYTFKALQSSILRCEAKNDFGSSNSSSIFLVTDVEKNFSLIKNLNIITVGDNVTLNCGVCKYSFSNNVTWYLNNSKSNKLISLTNSSGITFTNKNSNFSYHSVMNILNISKSQSGEYICEVTNTLNTDNTTFKFARKSIFIDVFDIQKPILERSNETIWKIKAGKSVIWDCIAKGIPTPTIKWFKDGKPLNLSQNNSISLSTNNQTLFIKFAAFDDEGEYSCIAVNKAGNASILYTLILTDKPGSHVIFVILCLILTLITGICIIWLAIRIQKERKFKKELAKTGLLYFEQGAINSLNPDLGIEDQAELLPYDRRWEFPIEKLKFGKQLGSGAFGVVMKAEADGIIDDNTTTTVAVKMVKQGADSLYIRALSSELKIMIHLGRHLNVVNLLGACTKNIYKRELVVIVEYCKYGNLHDFLMKQRNNFINQIDESMGYIDFSICSLNENGKLNQTSDSDNGNETLIGSDGYLINKDAEPDWRSNYRGDYRNTIVRPIKTADLVCWSFQIARGMEYLASRKVLHGDLAARNVLLADDNIVKICDFGLAKSMYNSENYQRKHSDLLPVRWMAIESIRDRVFSIQSDVWSFGITMWELFSLSVLPYPNIDSLEILYNKLVSGYRLEQPPYATKDIYEVMLDCWHSRPTLRPTFTELSERLGVLLEDGVQSHYMNLNEVYLKMNSDMNSSVDYLALLSPPIYNCCEEPRYVNVRSLSNRESPELEEDVELKPMLHHYDSDFTDIKPTCFLNRSYAEMTKAKRPLYVNTVNS